LVYGGKGAYASGNLKIAKDINFYVYIGQSGENLQSATFNGGGDAYQSAYGARSGGGSTDIRLTYGVWNSFESLKSRIIVAGGGGGADHYGDGSNGGYAGALIGENGKSCGANAVFSISTGGSQNIGGKGGGGPDIGYGYDGKFGYGGNASHRSHGAGGGGGYFGGGGGGANPSIVCSGGGGSSFISGYSGCNAIKESSTESNIINSSSPNHYSGYVFSNSVMIAGNAPMPSPVGSTETGHTGNGCCLITQISF